MDDALEAVVWSHRGSNATLRVLTGAMGSARSPQFAEESQCHLEGLTGATRSARSPQFAEESPGK